MIAPNAIGNYIHDSLWYEALGVTFGRALAVAAKNLR